MIAIGNLEIRRHHAAVSGGPRGVKDGVVVVAEGKREAAIGPGADLPVAV